MKNVITFLLTITTLVAAAQCDQNAIFNNTSTNAVCTEVDGAVRYFYANSIPDHSTGNFPNANNPNMISVQQLTHAMCAYPEQSNSTVYLDEGSGSCPFWEFGTAVNGLIFDPIAAEFFTNTSNGQQNMDWNENPLSPNINLGTDVNNAHVQPTGKYHYHGDPVGLINNLGATSSAHSPIIGYAADGYPLYYRYVYSDPNNSNSGIIDVGSCYQLKSGNRPGDGISAPDGTYDGTYTQDYEYIGGGSCELDECNGRFGITPDYPSGTYYYVMTSNFPVIPRCFKGNPDMSFTIGPPFGGCATSNANQICTLPTGTGDVINALEQSITFTNPVTDIIKLKINDQLKQQIEKVSIIDNSGKTVLTGHKAYYVVDVSNLHPGIYYLYISTGEESLTKKFVKN